MKSFEVFGKVQGIMFRQTFIRGLQKRKLQGGATNDPTNKNRVTLSIDASPEIIENVINDLTKTAPLNSWGAEIESFNEIPLIKLKDHEVTTDNVDQFKWTPGVKFYF